MLCIYIAAFLFSLVSNSRRSVRYVWHSLLWTTCISVPPMIHLNTCAHLKIHLDLGISVFFSWPCCFSRMYFCFHWPPDPGFSWNAPRISQIASYIFASRIAKKYHRYDLREKSTPREEFWPYYYLPSSNAPLVVSVLLYPKTVTR